MANKFICPLPWISLSLGAKGQTRLCCHQKMISTTIPLEFNEALKMNHTAKARAEFSQNRIPKECLGCLELEEAGCRSPRQDYMDRFSIPADGAPIIKYLDLTVDNHCNLECLMCSPLYSRKISSFFEQEMGAQTLPWKTTIPPEKLEKIIPNLEQVTLTGGEPFLSDESLKIIHSLAAHHRAPEIVLRLFTNMTVLPPSLSMLEKFKRVELIMSIDSTGENYELIRYPADWGKVRENIRRIRNAGLTNLDLHCHCVLTALNWGHIDQLIQFFSEEVPSHNLLPVFVEIESPRILHPRVLPEHLLSKGKENILNALKNLKSRNAAHEREIKNFEQLAGKIMGREIPASFLDYQIYLQKITAHRQRRAHAE